MTPLVGRDAELARFGIVLAQAGQGAGSVVLVSGEAGIGKTRLCAELTTAHQRRGGQALLGRATPEEASVPYAALADALRRARRTSSRVWEAVRARADILWAVAPELDTKLAGPVRSVDRPVIFEALLDAVDEAAGEETTLWVLDDLQWADDSTWEFVRYAARRADSLALVLAVTFRGEEIGPDHPQWPGLVRLKREPTAVSLPLARLGAADGERLIRSLDAALPQDTVTEIVRRSAGTPLLVEELAALAMRPSGVLLVPDIVRLTVRERLGRLDARARALAEAAAVAGLEADPELLASVCPGADPADLVSVGLLDQEDDRFRFRHPLLQEAAYAEIPPERRRALHERLAVAMAAGGYRAERVAGHLERAGRPHDALAALEAAAGDTARTGPLGRQATLHLGAFQLAGRHGALADLRPDLGYQAVFALFNAGRWTELHPLLHNAWASRTALPWAERARLAGVFGTNLLWTGAVREALAVVTAELALVERNSSLDDAGPLLREAALIAWHNGAGAAARGYAERAVEIAERTGDARLALRARRFQIVLNYGERGDPEAAVSGLRANMAAAQALGLGFPDGLERWRLSHLPVPSGHDEDSTALVSWQADAWSWDVALQQATLHLVAGRPDASAAVFRQIRREFGPGVPTIPAWVDAKEACLSLHHGDLAEAQRLLSGPRAASDASSLGLVGAEWSAALGWLAWEQGRFEEASARLAGAGSEHVMRTYNTISWGPAFLPLRVDALLRVGQAGAAASAVAAAEAGHLGHGRYMAAALAAARFRLEQAPDLAVAAAAATKAAPWPWLHALAGCWRGEFLRDTAAAGAAREEFEAIGARLGVQRAEAVLRGLGVRVPGRDGPTSTLSPRELEVAELVAEGLTNPAIARRLYLSRPTVASHVAHILAKLDFSSRAQIAAWVTQRRAQAP